MNDYRVSEWDTRQCELDVILNLLSQPEKYVNNLPYPVQEADFSGEVYRKVFGIINQLHNNGEPCNKGHVLLYFKSHTSPEEYRTITHSLYRDIEHSMEEASRVVRQAALERRLKQDAYADEETRAAEQQELDGIYAQIRADELRQMEEERERQRMIELTRWRDHVKWQAQHNASYCHPMLPVVTRMIAMQKSGEHNSDFWSYGELRTVCEKVMGFDPMSDSREVRSFFPERLLEYLEDHERAILLPGKRYRNVRGLKLLFF